MGAALCLHVFYSNVVIAYIDADQLILNFIDYNPKATDPTNPADTRPEVATQAEMLAAPTSWWLMLSVWVGALVASALLWALVYWYVVRPVARFIAVWARFAG